MSIAWAAIKAEQIQLLPVLGSSVVALQRLSRQSEEAAPRDIVEVVERDALLTLKLLLTVHHMPRGRIASDVTTVEHALMLLGASGFFRMMGVPRAIERTLHGEPAVVERIRLLLSRARHAALQARQWGALRLDVKVDEVATAALLYDFAELVLLALPELRPGVTPDRRTCRRLDQQEQQLATFGTPFHEIRTRLADIWRFPETLAELFSATTGRVRALTVQLSHSMARGLSVHWCGELQFADLATAAELLQLPPDEILEQSRAVALAAARDWRWYGVLPAAARLPLEPGEEFDDEAAGAPAAKPAGNPKAAAEAFDAAMVDVEAQIASGTTLQQLMSSVIRGMKEGLGLQRIVFALLTPDLHALKARYVVGADPVSPLQSFHFPLDGETLLTMLMRKMQSAWVSAETAHRFEPLLPPGLREMVGEREFFIMSLFVQDKPVGLFYADGGEQRPQLSAAAHVGFKQLCLRASEGLGRLSKR